MNDEDDNRGEIHRLRGLMEMKMSMFEAQLRKLAELRDEGLITEEEFAAKKAELLARL